MVLVLVPLGLAPGVTVSVFCSHAASKAAPAKMQKYFFMISGRLDYGEGEAFVVLTFVFVSVLVEAAGDSFTTVVLFSVLFSPGGLVTVVSLCSQAASNAAPVRMQRYFFIVLDCERNIELMMNRSKHPFRTYMSHHHMVFRFLTIPKFRL